MKTLITLLGAAVVLVLAADDLLARSGQIAPPSPDQFILVQPNIPLPQPTPDPVTPRGHIGGFAQPATPNPSGLPAQPGFGGVRGGFMR